MKNFSSKKAVSLIEVMVAIIIFFMGLVSVYSVISSTIRINEYNKNYIIASNLAREPYEIISNIRDYNFQNIRSWDLISNGTQSQWEIDTYYRVGNRLKNSSFLDTWIEKIENFQVGQDVLSTGVQDYRLCIDENGYYGYECINNTPTPFYRYVRVSEVSYDNQNGERVVVSDALKFESVVIWYAGGYHETKISFILTDWQRL